MAQYIDKSALVAEIERRRKDWRYGSSIEAKYKKEECNDILSFLDTLEVKEANLEEVHYKPLDEDFERDAVSFCFDNGLNTTPHIAKTIVKHFFELGLKAQKGE